METSLQEFANLIQAEFLVLFIKMRLFAFCFISFIIASISFFIWYKLGIFREKVNEVIQHHLNKQNTVTCGGVIFLIILLIFIQNQTKPIKLLLLVSLIATVIGLIDDVKKIKTGDGLSRYTHIFSCGLIGVLPIHYNWLLGKTYILLPYYSVNLGLLFYIPFCCCLFIGTISGANFSDGINGGLAIPALTILCFFMQYIYQQDLNNSIQVLIYLSVLIGCLFSFLIFNLRGKIFMGNCGSLFLGANIATLAMIYKIEIIIPFCCIWLVLNVLSVIINVVSIKYFKKRIFRMSPLHHHFELMGFSETQIDIMIFVITFIFSYVSFYLL